MADHTTAGDGFVRITRMRFDPNRRTRLEELWRTVSAPHASTRAGFRRIRACLSLEEPGLMFIVSEWESQEAADAYLADPEHQVLVDLYAREVGAAGEKWACRWIALDG